MTPRRRIWQLDPSMHCSVLGTCLSLHDLHAIARRAGYKLEPSTSAYVLHSWFVDMMATANEVSKLVDKTLEKRHHAVTSAIRHARTREELEARWNDAVGGSHLASAYWAAMSHPLCSKDLQWHLFGEIHMLSHLVGSSRRSDLGRQHQLEVACAAADGKLAQLKHDHRAVLKDNKRLEDEREVQQRELERTKQRLVFARDRIAALESQTLAGELEARIAVLERGLADAAARATAADQALREVAAQLAEARATGEIAAAQVRELTVENAALENELAASMGVPDGAHDAAPGGLDGKRILCVGGRSGLVQHYRALVERRGGELVHHDGGLEESPDAVTRALATVDTVLCPVDCVSHAAYFKVKRACKHLGRRLVLLRTSGLSSFARALDTIAATP